jgi:hypothetical protein
VRKKAYENVLGITGEETTAVEDTKGAMRTYDCGFAMENKFKRGLPLSVVEVEDRYGTKFGCVIGNDRFVPLRIVKYKKTIAGLAYHEWEIGCPTTYSEESMAACLDWDQVTRCAVMLPLLGENGFEKNTGVANPVYAVIDSQWNEMDEWGRFGMSS